jgi:CubicO group peptidase (beta-lactamase class C family)
VFWSVALSLILIQDPATVDCHRHLESKKIVGMSVAVSVHGKIEYEKGFGYQDRENKVLANEYTVYRLGSVSKPVTAIAIMREVEAKRLELDKDVRDYVNEWPQDKPGITLQLIMTHTSGLRHYKANEKEVFTHYASEADALALFKDDPLIAPTGTKYSYSTHAWTLAAAVLEAETGKKMPALIADLAGDASPSLRCEDLTQEIDHHSSALYGPVGDSPALYTKREDNSWKYGGGGLVSSARDLANFATRFIDGKVVRPDTVAQMLRPVGGAAGANQGLAWRVNGTRFNHTGAQQGCSAALFCDQKAGVAVVVLCNTESGAPAELAQKLLGIWAPATQR